MSEELIFDEDVQAFTEITSRFSALQDTDFLEAFNLHKDALAQYDRWSTILFEIRRAEVGGKRNPALKDRIEDILKILNNVYTSSRMVYGRGKDDYDTKFR